MPIVTATDVLKVTFGFGAWNGNEIASFGVHFGNADGSSVASLLDTFPLDGAFNALVNNLVLGTYPGLSASVYPTEVRVALLNNRGQQQGASRIYAPTIVPTGEDTSKYIPQHSVVVTTVSDVRSGPTSKGRFYLPPGFGLPVNNGKIPAADIDTVADKVQAFGDDLEVLAVGVSSNLHLVNFSAYTPQRAGSLNRVIQMRVGNVVDTQRRRRNGLQEEYTRRDLA